MLVIQKSQHHEAKRMKVLFYELEEHCRILVVCVTEYRAYSILQTLHLTRMIKSLTCSKPYSTYTFHFPCRPLDPEIKLPDCP